VLIIVHCWEVYQSNILIRIFEKGQSSSTPTSCKGHFTREPIEYIALHLVKTTTI
jgi:hypothetical protein